MKTKCEFCNKKVLLSNTCKCNKIFCMKHHHPEDHNCTFDFKQDFKDKFTKLNPIIKIDKIDKIN